MRYFIIIIIALFFASCGNGASENKNAKKSEHTHADGTVHVHDNCEGHAEENSPNQESFKVEADSSVVKSDSVKNTKSNSKDCCEGHKHDHKH
jgi:PBP1b-binding outer membrane lipoprotein LpoB